VFARHDDACPVRNGRPCRCGVLGYRSSVRDWETSHRILSPLLPTATDALAWQQEQEASLLSSRGVPLEGRELGDVIDEFLEAANEGRACDRWGKKYTEDGLHQLRGALSYVDAALGLLNVADVRRGHVQGLVDQLVASGLTIARVYAVVDALEALYAYAIETQIVGATPVVLLDLPGAAQGTTAIDDPAPSAAPDGTDTTASGRLRSGLAVLTRAGAHRPSPHPER
jgi:hypothetical protein